MKTSTGVMSHHAWTTQDENSSWYCECHDLRDGQLTTCLTNCFTSSAGWMTRVMLRMGGVVVACRAVPMNFSGLLRCLVCSVVNIGRSLDDNALTTLPAGIFEGLTALKRL